MMNKMVPRASLLPGMVPADQHIDLWQQSIAPMLKARTLDPPGSAFFLPEIHQYYLERFLLIDCKFASQHFSRDPSMMARHDDTDHLTLHLFVRGENHVRNGGVSYRQDAGNVSAVNLAYDVEARSTASEAVMLVLPRQLILDEVPGVVDLRGPAFAEGSVCARLFIDHMLSLRRLLPEAGVDSIPALTKALLGLIDALMVHGDPSATVVQSAMFASVCRYIDQNLDDPGLGPDSLCARFRCSRATLYRLFKAQGGVREHIQRRRLMACFKAISAPANQHRRIFDLALDYGFVSPSHFSHLFRQHFDMSPSEARELGQEGWGRQLDLGMPSGGTAVEDVERMWRWAKSLTASAVMHTLQ